MKKVLTAILISYLCAGLAFAGGYRAGAGARRPVAHYPLNVSGTIDPDNLALATACWNFDSVVGANYTDDCSGVPYTMTVNGAPVRVDDATWPVGLSGSQGKSWHLDKANDWMSRVSDGTFNPTGDFSVRCAGTPDSAAGGRQVLMGKWTIAGNQRGWDLEWNNANVLFLISVDGTAVDTTTKANVLAAHRPTFITATYEKAATTVKVYVDGATVETELAAPAGVHPSTGAFTIGADNAAANKVGGLLSDCAFYDGVVLTDHDHAFAQWQGRLSSAGNILSIASASPPAIPMCPLASGDGCLVAQPANSQYAGSPVAGSGGVFSPTALTSKWWRGSCETCAGGDCTGWQILENQGGGAGTVVCDCDTTNSVHGGTSILFTSNGGGAPRYAYANGACQNAWIGQDLTLIVYGETLTGTASCRVGLIEYSAPACVTAVAQPVAWGWANPGANWTELKGTVAAATWDGTTVSWRPIIQCQDNAAAAYTVVFDVAMALQEPSTFATDATCCTDADTDAVCTATIPSITSPLSANGAMTVEGTWRSPWAGVDIVGATGVFFTDGNWGAANTYRIYLEPATDELAWSVVDNASGNRAVAPNVLNWAADTDYTVLVRTGGNNDLGLYWNSSWQTTAAGAGTGTRSAAQPTTTVGSSHNTPANVWTQELKVYPRTKK